VPVLKIVVDSSIARIVSCELRSVQASLL